MRVLIAGGGQVAALIARRLAGEGNEVVLVEAQEERCRQLEAELDAKVVRGSAASVETLRQAGVAEAEMLIAVTDHDEVNMLACLVAHVEARPDQVRVARLRTHEVGQWRALTEKAGIKIDLIIHPETEIAERILRVVRLPGVSDVLEFAGGEIQLFGMNVEPDSWLVGKSMEDLQAAGPPRDSLIALIFRDQQVVIPHGPEVLRAGDHVYTVGTRENQLELMRFMGLTASERLERVMVVGGKQVGIRIARALGKRGVQVKLFEQDAARAERIAALLEKTVVVNADGTDQAVLTENNVAGADAFLALTNDDADNIIASMLARKSGVRKVAALINRLSYLPMAQRLGIATTVSPRLAAVDRILQFVRKGRVLSVTTFREEEAEAIELIATAGSKYVGRPLRDVRFPRDAIVGAIARAKGGVLVPRGDVSIEPGDRVIFFALERVVPQLEAAFLAGPRKARR